MIDLEELTRINLAGDRYGHITPGVVGELIAEVRRLREAQIADDVRVERYLMRDGFEVIRVVQRAGADKWKVFNGGYCLTKSGDWEWEPMPSSRADDFIKRCRFDSAQEAIDAARREST